MTITKNLQKQTKNGFIDVTITTERNYFSITGCLWSSKRTFQSKNENFLLCAGCIHDEILKAFPDLKIFVDLHLSNLQGEPLYFLENGKYFIKAVINNDQKYTIETIKNHFRIDEGEANNLIDLYKNNTSEFLTVLAGYLPRYKEEAKTALNRLKTL